MIDMSAVAAHFWSRVDTSSGPSGCWYYGRQRKHYATVYFAGSQWTAHRLSYILTYGLPASHEVIRHACDNPACCNPAHLSAGSQSDNIRDIGPESRNTNPDAQRQYIVRLPPWLYNYLKQSAEGKRRSMNAEIVERLAGDVRKDGRRMIQEAAN